VKPFGAPPEALEDVERIKLVSPDGPEITKGTDGLFRRKDGQEAEADANVTLVKGALEASNVNAIEEMTSMIGLQRQFEMQVKMMKTAEENDQHHNQIFRIV
jgi:flagellar basal-body rod protein FlgF